MSDFRQNKKAIVHFLASPDWEEQFKRLLHYLPSRQIISPLFSALYSLKPEIRWHAVSCFGLAVTRLAQTDGLERCRVVMRRLTWNLNEESGGIGWGAPEALGEIMARHSTLAQEYHQILISYVLQLREADNFLDCLQLREGAYWGIARLSQVRPELLNPFASYLEEAIYREESPFILGCACLIQAHAPQLQWDLPGGIPLDRMRNMQDTIITLYWDKELWNVSLGELWQGAQQTANNDGSA